MVSAYHSISPIGGQNRHGLFLPLQFAQCLPSTFHPHAQPFHRVGYQTFSGQIGFLDHHASEQPVRHDRGGRAGGFHHADEDRSPDASGHGIVAWLPEPSSRAVSSMTAVPQEAARASCRPSHGISHRRQDWPGRPYVAKPTNGATIRFAGMENTGSSGSMSTWIGR